MACFSVLDVSLCSALIALRITFTLPSDQALTKAKPITLDTGEEAVEITRQQIDYTYEFKTWLLGLGGSLISLRAEAADKKINPAKDIKDELRLMAKQLL